MNSIAKNNISVLDNALAQFVCSNDALKILSENVTDQTDVSILLAIIDILSETSHSSGLMIAEKFIECSQHEEAVLNKMVSLLFTNPYTVHDDFEGFKDCLRHIYVHHYNYSYETLISLAECLEFIFAHGIKALSKDITQLYRILPVSAAAGEEYRIHKKLICAYEYNGLNYNSIYNRLTGIHQHCRVSKKKYLYGMVNYYFAVLGVLSRRQDIYNGYTRIDLACRYDYRLAAVLRDSYTI